MERAALEYVADIVADGKTECTVLLPRRAFHSRLARVLHDRTADRIADAVGGVAHVAATIVPFNLEAAQRRRFRPNAVRPETYRRKPMRGAGVDRELARRATGTIPISDVTWRTRVRVAGRIRSLRVQTAKGTANLECEITDDTGILLLVFQGRPKIPGIEPGARLIVEGMVGSWQATARDPQPGLRAGQRVAIRCPAPEPDPADLWTLSDLCTPWCIRVVATLHIAEHIASGVTDIAGLATATASDTDALHSVLSYLVERGVFIEDAAGTVRAQRRRRGDCWIPGYSSTSTGSAARMAQAWSTLPSYRPHRQARRTPISSGRRSGMTWPRTLTSLRISMH